MMSQSLDFRVGRVGGLSFMASTIISHNFGNLRMT